MSLEKFISEYEAYNKMLSDNMLRCELGSFKKHRKDVSNDFILKRIEFGWQDYFLATRPGSTAEFAKVFYEETGRNICTIDAYNNENIDLKYLLDNVQNVRSIGRRKRSDCRKECTQKILDRTTLTPEEMEMVVEQYKLTGRYRLRQDMMSLTTEFVRWVRTISKGDDICFTVLMRYLDVDECKLHGPEEEWLCELATYPRHIEYALNFLEEYKRNGEYDKFHELMPYLCENPALTMEHIIDRPHFDWEEVTYKLFCHQKHLFPDIFCVFPNWDWADIPATMLEEEDKLLYLNEINPVQFYHGVMYFYRASKLFDENLVRIFFK